jgi:hypothetical protein
MLTSMPRDILCQIIRWVCGPRDAKTMCAVFMTCKVLNIFIYADWKFISAIYTEVYSYTEQGYTIIQHFFCGRLHRADGPAEYNRTSTVWYHHGRRHRAGDAPAVIAHNKHVLSWYQYGHHHRDVDLPAHYYTDTWVWFQRDRRHRNVGPAMVEVVCNGAVSYPCLLPWDGLSDVSADDFDWRQILLITSTTMTKVVIKRTWYTNNNPVKRQLRRLRMADNGAWILGDVAKSI